MANEHIIIECLESKECAPFKHHYDECAERVKAAAEAEENGEKHKGPKEDCVEEYFHMMHCAVSDIPHCDASIFQTRAHANLHFDQFRETVPLQKSSDY